ncbi:MAG: chloride channel protein [Bdellovibrionaceae bacterium]|nr:chloride channel protein [Pseudobdellovibrionaceae bacterium]
MTSIAIGLLCFALVIFSVGAASALFLNLLSLASQTFFAHDELILALPVLGLITGIAYSYFDEKIHSTQRIVHQAHEPTHPVPSINGVLIFCFTILSHLFGASVGRESTAVQFAVAIGDSFQSLLQKLFPNAQFDRQRIVRSALAAGFGAIFGVPWAGAIFALEVTPHRRWPFQFLPWCLVSSFGANAVAKFLGASHVQYPAFGNLRFTPMLLLKWVCLGALFGITAKVFLILFHSLEKYFFRAFFKKWLSPFVGACLVAAATLLMHDTRYNGLGLQLIRNAMEGPVPALDFIWKSLFTVVSSASGLKGGEVTPLMAIGASLGAAAAGWMTLPAVYAASLGLVAVFAASAHIPWTGAIMAWELFGFEAFLPAFIICWIARRFVGLRSLMGINE